MSKTESLALLRSGAVTTLTDALATAEAHYLECAIDAHPDQIVACEAAVRDLHAVRDVVRSAMRQMRTQGIPKQMRRARLIKALSEDYSEWSEALQCGDYRHVI